MKILSEILKYFPYKYELIGEDNVMIQAIKVDSRDVLPGDLFVCIDGYTVDGHQYTEQAINNGAVAIIAHKPVSDERATKVYVKDTSEILSYLSSYFYDFPSNDFHLIGVTGTNGKTSITYLLDELFQLEKKKTGVLGTIQMKIDQNVYPIANTTPEPSYLHRHFKEMVDHQIDHVLMEVSSHALELGRVNGCDFDIAIFTNLTQDHLDFHETMEDYLRAKMRLFYQLGNRYSTLVPKRAIVNCDDPHHQSFASASSQPIIRYGLTNEADVYAEDINLDANGTSFKLTTISGTVQINSPLMGRFNVYNMLAAAAAAEASGVSLETIQRGFNQTKGVPGRFEPVKGEHGFGVVIDYAHTPDSLENVLSTIKQFAKGSIYLVVGCGGDRDKTKRPLMATVGEKYANHSIFTADNPRSEDPMQIIADMEKGMSSDRYEVEVDRQVAIERAVGMAKETDVVLIAGKGHETYQIIGDKTLPFNDYKVAENAIKGRGEHSSSEVSS
ncbi:UDP-N-acetylmuramoylalanyl-D-glutamate--2,6-diaminopimelate ligase [Pelagirhabdus alkalitolerans]|uniref:UDP-N-acetylmuramoyl-L-alanyl-D-glutamate--2,6-diaminopimelate ligase n=1 Tax=Pelagirhabdus alkalitolerans TaxID=1612202 RepID=A0A1G6GZV4_9BACI|nr:UDP-N-acetylmuramoyl-L-alanyl-D-glutamate--2,6-diaminopimelate ligase [Pelagirhabdus alkalitolerans]SDB87539.1 UDP-N-acetylmuramoylalanyl-D-glutamate--2,6-diaminopimelate ligase [Pelagirhabdus alkalitolerans]